MFRYFQSQIPVVLITKEVLHKKYKIDCITKLCKRSTDTLKKPFKIFPFKMDSFKDFLKGIYSLIVFLAFLSTKGNFSQSTKVTVLALSKLILASRR